MKLSFSMLSIFMEFQKMYILQSIMRWMKWKWEVPIAHALWHTHQAMSMQTKFSFETVLSCRYFENAY